ncbi:MAG TPA: hypothetical protein VLM37_02080 [Fibrobacteraceae bacterium]|nr:hypothetical protein [Fibrobacteraceae bacterium]
MTTLNVPQIVGLFRDSRIQEILSGPRQDSLVLARRLANDFSAEERYWILEWVGLYPEIRRKFGIGFPLLCDRLALEQATARDLSEWKASLWPRGSKVLDLCCGMGGDSLFLASDLIVEGVDRDPLRLAMYEENTRLLGCVRSGRAMDALDPELQADFFQIDPARRTTWQGNQRRIGDLSPSWEQVSGLFSRFSGGVAKLPPGFPWETLPKSFSISCLGGAADCRECMVSHGVLAEKEPVFQATLLPEGLTYTVPRNEMNQTPLPVGDVGAYLFEPVPVLIRSHLFPHLARQQHLHQVDEQIAYLSGERLSALSPWLRQYKVLDRCPLGQGRVRAMLRKHGIHPTALKKRGVEVDPAKELRQLDSGGDSPGILFYTRVRGQKTAILTLSPEKR